MRECRDCSICIVLSKTTCLIFLVKWLWHKVICQITIAVERSALHLLCSIYFLSVPTLDNGQEAADCVDFFQDLKHSCDSQKKRKGKMEKREKKWTRMTRVSITIRHRCDIDVTFFFPILWMLSSWFFLSQRCVNPYSKSYHLSKLEVCSLVLPTYLQLAIKVISHGLFLFILD